jgi:chromosome segregation ATPase
MAPAPSPPPTRGSAVEDTRRKLLLDDLVAGPEVLAQPVLHVDPVSLDAIPSNRGRRRIEDVEEAVGRNLRSAEEARRALQAEHKRLEAEAGIRRKLEREVGSLRRDIERTQESERLRVAQARYTAEREARKEVLAEVEAVSEEHNRALGEIERLRTALDSDRALMSEFSDRLRDEQQAKAKAQTDADAAMEARRQAEHRLETLTENARRRADEELQRLAVTEAALRDALAERDQLANEVVMAAEEGRGRDLTQTVADLENLVAELEANLTAERARTDNAMAHAAELTEELDAARVRSQESLRSLGQMEQLEAELEGAVVAHGAAVDRVRMLDEERALLQEQLDELRAAPNDLDQEVTKLRIELSTSTRERDALAQEVARLTELVDAANAKTASNEKVRELERLLDISEAEHDSLMQEVSDLRVELAERTAAAPAVLVSTVDEDALAEARAARDAFAKQVQELERGLASSLERRDVALRQVGELERALSQEQLRVREAEEELRRLHSTASVDARAVATGRAEPDQPALAQIPVAQARVAAPPVAAPPPPPMPPARVEVSAPAAAAAAPEQAEPPEEPGAPNVPKVERRSAMAEFAAIASLDASEGYRRR